jgi:hypothetical protein
MACAAPQNDAASAAAGGAPAPFAAARDPSHRELRTQATERRPSVEAFVMTHSAVVRAAFDDDPATCWIVALPPFTADLPFERCIDQLAVLDRLYGQSVQSLDPFRICRIRSEPLFPVLACCSESDLAQLRLLTEYLQLPKELASSLDLHNACMIQLGKSDAARDGRLSDYICGSAALKPLLDAAVASFAAATHKGAYSPWSVCSVTYPRMGSSRDAALDALFASHFLPGLCGDPLPEGSTPESEVVYVGALASAGHRIPARPPRTIDIGPCSAAAALGRVEALAALVAAGWSLGDCRNIIALAAVGGHVSVLQWLVDSGHLVPASNAHCPDIMTEAASKGRLAVLEWFCNRGAELPHIVCAAAAHWGHLHIVEWLITRGWVWTAEDSLACSGAARFGHLPLLRLLCANGCPCDVVACYEAAGAGHLHILQWLAAQAGAPAWDENVCAAAAANGHLGVLQWLRAQHPPCPWDSTTIERAYSSEVVAWARENGCPERA